LRRSGVEEQQEYGFGTAIFVLDHTADKVTPEEADRSFGEVTKENFWRMWPAIREWAETFVSQIRDRELRGPALTLAQPGGEGHGVDDLAPREGPVFSISTRAR
jgi:hypothetical protein